MEEGESYDAFTQRTLAQQRVAYASLTFAQEQRRLRMHLRRILLRQGGVDRASRQPSRSPEELTRWREEAIARDLKIARRHASAQTIQRRVRRWLAGRGDLELSSTSEWVEIVSAARPVQCHAIDEPTVTTVKPPVARQAPAAHESDLPLTPATLTEAFQLIVELLGARDLALGQQSGPVDITADVRLVHAPSKDELGGLEAVGEACAGEDINWDDHVLQLGVDSPERVLAGGAVYVQVFLGRTSLGRLSVSLDLLETPLADRHAMTRWFPLEPGRGRPAKGEVRLGIRFLMRNPTRCHDGDDVWVPYEGTSQSDVTSQSSSARKAPTKKPQPGKPPLSPQKYSAKSAISSKDSNGSVASKPARYARVEVISPPSSPSSLSSDSTTEVSPIKSAAARASPSSHDRSPIRRRSSGGIVSSASKQRTSFSGKKHADSKEHSSRTEPLSHWRDSDRESGEPSRPMFLKRKPYKVVFQKLDWSRVNAKTDSNWGSSSKSGSAGATRAAASPRVVLTKDPVAPTPTPSKSACTSATSDRIAAVAQQIYAACRVTKETMPLAQMRFRGERTRWLQSIKKSLLGKEPTRHDKAEANGITDESLHKLWTDLLGDADGSKYTAWLLAETEKCSKLTAKSASSST